MLRVTIAALHSPLTLAFNSNGVTHIYISPLITTAFAPSSNAELKAAIAECRTAPANDGPKDHALTTSPYEHVLL